MSDETENTETNDAVVADEVTAKRGRKPKEAEPAKASIKLFPVILRRNYHPIHDFTIDGEIPTPEERTKVFAGTAIEMDKDEAVSVISKGIAVRNDPFN